MKPSVTEKLLSPTWLFVEASVFQIAFQFYLYYRYAIEGNAEMGMPPLMWGVIAYVFSITGMLFIVDYEKEQKNKNKKPSALFKLIAFILYCVLAPLFMWLLNTL